MKKTIKAKVGTKEAAGKEFIETWHKASTNKITTSDDKLYFENAELLLKTLTPKRLQLLRAVWQQKKISIRALSKLLERDYKNVHQETKILEDIGLLHRDSDDMITMPWETIITEIPMSSHLTHHATPKLPPKKSAAR